MSEIRQWIKLNATPTSGLRNILALESQGVERVKYVRLT